MNDPTSAINRNTELPSYLKRAEIFMCDNIGSLVTNEQIAKAAGCSERALLRMFNEYYGKQPLQLLQEYRKTLSGACEETE